MTEIIHILIADDHRMVREGLKAFLRPFTEFEIIGEASRGEETIRLVTQLHPDILLLDLMMPDLDGIQVLQALRRQGDQVPVLVISSYAEDELIEAAIQAGASGYLLKDSSPQELENAIRRIQRGETFLPPHPAYKAAHPIHKTVAEEDRVALLTPREIEILQLIANGLTNDEIAQKLVLSPWTVRSHLGRILKKLDVENRTQAAMAGLRAGIVSIDK